MGKGAGGESLAPVCLVSGSLAAPLLPALPTQATLLVATIIAALGLLNSYLRYPALALLACCWSLWFFHFALLDRLDPKLSGQFTEVEGQVSSVPQVFEGYTRFRFKPADSELPDTLLVYWYREWPELRSGQRWRLLVKMKPPWSHVNFHGSDRERWLFANGIGGLASVREGEVLAGKAALAQHINRLRERVLAAIGTSLEDGSQRGIVQALATAERSGLDAAVSRVLFLTGTSHLLAISGLHIGLAAAAGAWLGRLLFWLLPWTPAGRTVYMLSLAFGMISAVAYAALAGFGISTQRALLMLLAGIAVFALRRGIHPFRAWLVALATVLLLDPFAPLGAGFWFSFLAVAALLAQFAPRPAVIPWWKTLLRAQWSVVLVLLPVSAAWFQAFSPVGFVANLFAIPWVSFLVVPFVLGGVAVLPLGSGLAAISWKIAGTMSGILLNVLQYIAGIQGDLLAIQSPGILVLALALLGGFLLLLPPGIPGRFYGLFLLAPLFLPLARNSSASTVQLDVLDAGQGTAVFLQAGGRSLLYDTGPGDGRDMNLVESIIAPTIDRLSGTRPDRVIVSHADLDHAGGLRSIIDRYPTSLYLVNHPDEPGGGGGCEAPGNWQWGNGRFEILHPSPGLPYRGNDSSCVLSVRAGHNSVLIAGDISSAVENRLVLDGLASHRVLIVPHHGSNSSSSPDFVASVVPMVAVATAGLGNRFGFPREEVVQRYTASGSKFWSTGACGGLRLTLEAGGGIEAHSARKERRRIWRWPANEQCP